MYRVPLFAQAICLALALGWVSPLAAEIVDSDVWINELHYDNDGADLGEFVEVAAPTAWHDLSRLSVTLYNGSTGSAYGGPVALHDFAAGATSGRYRFYTYEVSMQNGAPDGLALADGDNVLQFLSYEGSFTATDGVAQGLLSTDIGVLEATTAPVGTSLQLGGSGDSYFDFNWLPSAPSSPGLVNTGQTVVPEPGTVVLWVTAALPCLLYWRRARRWATTRATCLAA